VDYTPNATGTPAAHRPRHGRTNGDYEAWSPDA